MARSRFSRQLRGRAELPLFSALNPDGCEALVDDPSGNVRLYRMWLAPGDADALLAHILDTTAWAVERRKMYDRFVDVPREQAWRGDDRAQPWTPQLDAVRRRLERELGTPFSYVLLNRYRDGRDSVAWHSDREVEHLAAPTIASLTLGATRAFDLRPKDDRARVLSVDLDHGDLLVMRGETQRHWEHRVAKDTRISAERLNLTFRQQPE